MYTNNFDYVETFYNLKCEDCDYCELSGFCTCCNNCQKCDFCDYCNFCYKCEDCIFCYAISGKEYRIFNKRITEEEYKKIQLPKIFLNFEDDITYKDAFVRAWEKLNEEERKQFYTLPHFDSKIFEEITGVKV